MKTSCHLLSKSNWVKLLLFSTSVYCGIQVPNNNINFFANTRHSGVRTVSTFVTAHLEIIGFPVGSAY